MASIDALKEFNSTIIATVAALVVGVIMKYVTKVSDRRKDNLTEHLELRKELREELDAVKEELRQLQRDLDDWREKYYSQLEINSVLQAEVASLRLEISEYRNQTGESPILPQQTDE